MSATAAPCARTACGAGTTRATAAATVSERSGVTNRERIVRQGGRAFDDRGDLKPEPAIGKARPTTEENDDGADF